MGFATALLVAISGLAAASLELGPGDEIRVGPEGFFHDGHGRVRIFHGVNVVYKAAPWHPSDGPFDARFSLNDRDADLLRQWGFNIARIGVMWPGVEPTSGQYNETYLMAVSDLTGRLAKRGVYSLLDMHQDLLSRHFCGEGVPEHYVEALLADPASDLSRAASFPHPLPQAPLPLDERGLPKIEACLSVPGGNFANYYVTEKVGALFSNLYSPDGTLHKGFLRLWAKLAQHFAAAGPHILGYELLNEPSPLCLGGLMTCGSVPSAVGSDVEDRQMAPLYRAAAAEIRRSDATRPIFFESSIYPKISSRIFSSLPLGNDTQQVYAYHIYCPVGSGVIHDNICRLYESNYGSNIRSFLNRHRGLGGFMTEFGAVGNDAESLGLIERLLDLADDGLQSWAYWTLKDFHDFTTMNFDGPLYSSSGRIETRKLRALARTYAPAIAGTPLAMRFHPATAEFSLEFRAHGGATAPTELYLNEELHYPDGYDVFIEPAGCIQSEKPEPNRLHLHLQAKCDGQRIRVLVARRRNVQARVLV